MPAVAATAAGGVTAIRGAVQALADDIGAWLEAIAREQPAIAERCRAH